MRLALAGDTMLGRNVAETLRGGRSVFSKEVVAVAREADAFLLNLECCISERGKPWPEPGKPFFFRAPPAAVDVLAELGVDAVTLANNHALDFGYEALEDTLDLLDRAGIAVAGAGRSVEEARLVRTVEVAGLRIDLIGVTDHPSNFAATSTRPGVAYADLRREVPGWLLDLVRSSTADLTVVMPHWGPNMVGAPVPHVRAAARALRKAGAGLLAGSSAHVFHGVAGTVLFDLGDFVDDYAVDRRLRNDLGLLFLVVVDEEGPRELEAVPLRLDYCHTRLAAGSDAQWIGRRFRAACAEFDTAVAWADGRLVARLR